MHQHKLSGRTKRDSTATVSEGNLFYTLIGTQDKHIKLAVKHDMWYNTAKRLLKIFLEHIVLYYANQSAL